MFYFSIIWTSISGFTNLINLILPLGFIHDDEQTKETPCIVELSDSSGVGELTTTELLKIDVEVKWILLIISWNLIYIHFLNIDIDPSYVKFFLS